MTGERWSVRMDSTTGATSIWSEDETMVADTRHNEETSTWDLYAPKETGGTAGFVTAVLILPTVPHHRWVAAIEARRMLIDWCNSTCEVACVTSGAERARLGRMRRSLAAGVKGQRGGNRRGVRPHGQDTPAVAKTVEP